MGVLSDEFEHFLDTTDYSKTYIDESNELIEKAETFIKTSDSTNQGIEMKKIKKSLSFEETNLMPWKHVSITIDVSRLKPISNTKLTSFSIYDFIEEVIGICDNGDTEFGYNQSIRNNLEYLKVSSNVCVINPSAFAFYKKLERVIFEENSKLIYIGENTFACCEKLKELDLRNCKYLDDIPENLIAKSGVRVLKLNRNIKHVPNQWNTSELKYIYIDDDKYSIEEFNELMSNNDADTDVFWRYSKYDF